MNTNTNTAPATEEMKVLGAFLAAMHDNRLDGKKMREAMLWSLHATAAQPPAGWKLVPVEPTPEMCKAANGLSTNRNRWAAMLAAAPQPIKTSSPEIPDNCAAAPKEAKAEDGGLLRQFLDEAKAAGITHLNIPQAEPVQPERVPLSEAKELMERINTLIACVNEAHHSNTDEWRDACFKSADEVLDNIKARLGIQPAHKEQPNG